MVHYSNLAKFSTTQGASRGLSATESLLVLLSCTCMHICGQCVRILLLDPVDRSLCLFLIAACQYHVVASFTQVSRRLVAEPRARTCDDDYPASHRLTCTQITCIYLALFQCSRNYKFSLGLTNSNDTSSTTTCLIVSHNLCRTTDNMKLVCWRQNLRRLFRFCALALVGIWHSEEENERDTRPPSHVRSEWGAAVLCDVDSAGCSKAFERTL